MGTTLTRRDWNTLTYTLMDKPRMRHTHVLAHSAAHTATAAVMNGHRQTHTQTSTVTWLEERTPHTPPADHRGACFPSHQL